MLDEVTAELGIRVETVENEYTGDKGVQPAVEKIQALPSLVVGVGEARSAARRGTVLSICFGGCQSEIGQWTKKISTEKEKAEGEDRTTEAKCYIDCNH